MIGVGPPDAGSGGMSAPAEEVVASLRWGTHGTIRTLVSDIARVHRSSMITTVIVKSHACFLLRNGSGRHPASLQVEPQPDHVEVGGSKLNCPLR